MGGWSVGLGSVVGRPTTVITPPNPSMVDAGVHALGAYYKAMPGLSTDRYIDATNGNDSTGDGSVGSPWKTMGKASSSAPSGATIAMRGGTYRESISPASGKTLTFQPYPLTALGISEQVIMEGTTQASTWTNNGNGTWTCDYALVCDRFLGQGSQAALDSAYPGNARRVLVDQCWFGNNPQSQVADGTAPAAGQFSVNQSTHKLTVGSNPTGQSVFVSQFKTAIVSGATLNIAGIAIRRYSPDKLGFGNSMVYIGDTGPNSKIEEVLFEWSSMSALSFSGTGCSAKHFTIRNCGYAGLKGTTCDGLRVSQFHIHDCNKGDFAATPGGDYTNSPDLGAIKITRADDLIISQGIITDIPGAYAVWFDVSCTRAHCLDLDINGGGTMVHGIHYEEADGGNISGTQYQCFIANCRVQATTFSAFRAYAAGYTAVWNCYLNSGIGVMDWQDTRRNSGTNPANRDPAVVPWKTVGNDLMNSDISVSTGNKNGVIAYDNGGVWNLLPGNMLRTMKSCRIVSTGTCVQMRTPGTSGTTTRNFNTAAALAAANADVGGPFSTAKYDQNVFANAGSPAAPSTTQVLPNTLADLLGVAHGSTWFGCDTSRLPGVAA